MSVQDQRKVAVKATVCAIRMMADGRVIDRLTLTRMKEYLVAWARHAKMARRADFPAMGNEDDDTHLLSQDTNGRGALYLYSSGLDA